MKRLLILLLLLLLPMTACAVVTLPEQVRVVEDEAFAGTGLDGLILPASVERVGERVLADCGASYLYLQGAETVLTEESRADVPFVFGPAGGSAAELAGFYPTESLLESDGVYYSVEDTAQPLCAVEPSRLTGSLTIPKVLFGVPVTSLEALYLSNTGVTELYVPQYLTIPDNLAAQPYQTMTVTAPVADATETPAGRYVTWTASAAGAYGATSWMWRFDVNGESHSVITAEPTVKFAPMAEGTCIATVTAVDALGDQAESAPGAAVTVNAAQSVYRALLIGNTYPGADNELAGCDNDVAAMRTILSSMTGTDYQITTAMNLSSSGIRSRIASAFAGAQPGDVSLFHYSGHGNSDGSLVGTGNTLLSVYALRSALQAVPGTKIVILDCCHSGAVIGRSAAARSGTAHLSAFNNSVISAFASASRAADNLADGGFVVLTACRQDQQSNSFRDVITGVSFGAFTYALCYGSGYDEWKQQSLGSMPADTNGDGAITLGEAYAGVQSRTAYLNEIVGGALTQEVQYYGDSGFVLWIK